MENFFIHKCLYIQPIYQWFGATWTSWNVLLLFVQLPSYCCRCRFYWVRNIKKGVNINTQNTHEPNVFNIDNMARQIVLAPALSKWCFSSPSFRIHAKFYHRLKPQFGFELCAYQNRFLLFVLFLPFAFGLLTIIHKILPIICIDNLQFMLWTRDDIRRIFLCNGKMDSWGTIIRRLNVFMSFKVSSWQYTKDVIIAKTKRLLSI